MKRGSTEKTTLKKPRLVRVKGLANYLKEGFFDEPKSNKKRLLIHPLSFMLETLPVSEVILVNTRCDKTLQNNC